MKSVQELEQHVARRIRECRVAKRSMEIWLGSLAPANFLLVGLAGVLSLVAGASILSEQGLLTSQQAGVLALISASFTALHKGLKCEEHQAEIRNLRGAYAGLESEYDSLAILGDADTLGAKIEMLDAELARIRKSARNWPARRCVDRAKREDSATDP